MINFQFTFRLLSNFFPKLCMFLLLLCLGTIPAPTCPAALRPPRLGPSGRRGSTPSAALRWPLCGPAPRPPLLHHTSQVAGRGGRRQPPWGLHDSRRHAWQPAADRWACAQAVMLQPSGSCFQTCWFLHLPLHRHRHTTVPEPISYPVRRFLHARDWRRLHSLHRCGTCPVDGHRPRGWTSDLFSSQMVKPVWHTLVNLYSACI